MYYKRDLCGSMVKASRFKTTLLLLCGSSLNPMRGICQMLTEGCWFTPRNNLSLKLWKLTAIYNQIRLKNGLNI